MNQRSYKSSIVIFGAIMMMAHSVIAQDNSIKKEKFNWGHGDQDTTIGYTQAVKVENILYISGTVSHELTPEGIKRVYEALEKTLQHYSASFQNVVKENLYTTDIDLVKQYNYVRKPFYKGDFPAATWVQISRLFTPETKLEIELVAFLPNS